MTATAEIGRPLSRAERWERFALDVARLNKSECPNAFIQEIVTGLWCVQVLRSRRIPRFGWLYRLLQDPPSPFDFAPYYDGWPGDHRGWMRFESKEAARDFYKFATGRISREEYDLLPHAPLSDVRINLDHNGDFIGAINGQSEARK